MPGRPKTAAWRRALDAALNGSSLDDVTKIMEDTYKTPCSRRTRWSTLRVAYERHDAANRNVAKSMRASPEDAKACRSKQRTARRNKVSHLIQFDAKALLDRSLKVLSDPASFTAYELALVLMYVTGRRQTEITNGRSTFSSTVGQGREHGVRFAGQLKQVKTTFDSAKRKSKTGKRRKTKPYDIPTLTDPSVVIAGMTALRKKQKPDVSTLSNAQVSRRYQSALSGYAKRHPPWDRVGRLHNLRGAYAATCLRAFGFGDAPDNFAIMTMLGHSDPEEVIPYSGFRPLQKRDVPDLGEWTVDRDSS